jgi:hypothetical protein
MVCLVPVQKQIAGFQEVAVFGELLDRIAAVFEDAGVAVDIGDLGLAAPGRGEAGVVGEHAGLGVELGDVDHIGPDGAAQDREIIALVADREGRCLVAGFCVHRVVPDEIVAKIGLSGCRISRRWRAGPDRLESSRNGYLIALCAARWTQVGGAGAPLGSCADAGREFRL